MAMGMAGRLIDKPGLRLGDMFMRDSTIHFVIYPQADVFKGPVAILVPGRDVRRQRRRSSRED